MTGKPVVLITGANGEVGHGLIKELSESSQIIALDRADLDTRLHSSIYKFYRTDITDFGSLEGLFKNHKFDTIFHLAALLSTSGEKNPELAHTINVGGTFHLLSLAQKYGQKNKNVTKFIFPSTIAVYGMKDTSSKTQYPRVPEEIFINPITMYGINKLYCENLGIYFSSHYELLTDNSFHPIDFRSVRFPGLISAETVPSGGTSDYASEMIHAAAQSKSYSCFVRPDSTIAFMAMPDGIRALIELSNAKRDSLNQHVYNISGFSASAQQVEKEVKKNFPSADMTYRVSKLRQKIIDSWPIDIDDSKAQNDWGWKPEYDFQKTFKDYLIPIISNTYTKSST